jgi:hypothetical protein
MKRDLWLTGSGVLACGAVVWIFWGNPENLHRMHAVAQEISADPALKLVSQKSPYMRSER